MKIFNKKKLFTMAIVFAIFVGNEFYHYRVQINTNDLSYVSNEKRSPASTNQPELKFNDQKIYKRSFGRAKKILEHTIYVNHQKTFYAGAPLSYINKDLQPNLREFPAFKHRKNPKANGLDWEHVQPASRYGQTIACWGKAKTLKLNSRSYCAKHDSKYRAYESDLHNLVPAIAEINRDRSNYRFVEMRGHNNVYGKVDFSIDIKNKAVEPADRVKGDVARISLYMNSQYGINLSKDEISMYNRWNKLDKVSKWERDKNDMVYQIQGNKNPYIN